jgi:hypothetical protein
MRCYAAIPEKSRYNLSQIPVRFRNPDAAERQTIPLRADGKAGPPGLTRKHQMRRRALRLHVSAVAMWVGLAAGCATASHSPPGPPSIPVYDVGTTIPLECTSLGLVTAREGKQGEVAEARDGSRDRVISRLRKSAASRGGTAVAIRGEPEIICVDCLGSVVEIRAEVLRCKMVRH